MDKLHVITIDEHASSPRKDLLARTVGAVGDAVHYVQSIFSIENFTSAEQHILDILKHHGVIVDYHVEPATTEQTPPQQDETKTPEEKPL
jgi:hypothetical protein